MKKQPWLAGLFNIILSGLGYLYIGKRRLFGVLLIGGELLTFLALVRNPVTVALLSNIWVLIGSAIWKAALAIDAYNTARSVNKR